MPHNFIPNNVENDVPVRKLPKAMYLNRSCYCFMQHSMCCSRLCLASKRKFTVGHPVYDSKNHKFLRMFQRVGIGARTVELLYEFFIAIDVDGSGEISLSEFFNFFRMKDTAFARRAFSVMDEDGSGEIDFGEFTLTLYNFCSFTKEGLTRFAFELYDADGSGCIDMDELMAILKEMFGRKYKTNATANKIARQMERFDWRANDAMYDDTSQGGEVQITYIGFNEFVKKHPGILYPAFSIQMQLQQNILGSGFWLDEAQKQTKLKSIQDHVAKKVIDSGGEFSSNEYMVVQEDNAFFEQMLSMSVNDAANDLYIGTGGKESLEKIETSNGTDDHVTESINNTRATNKLSKYRKSNINGSSKKKSYSRSKKKSKLSDEEKREKKKDELKKKFKEQLKRERKRTIKSQRKEEAIRKKRGIFGFGKSSEKHKSKTFSAPEIVDTNVIQEDDPRRKLTLMKKNRVKSKKMKKVININAKARDQILTEKHDALPWICPTCKRSNYPDLKRCKTCHSLPKYKRS